MSASRLLRILLLEDNALDADLMSEYMTRDGLDIDVTRVWDRHGFSEALKAGGFDIVLADYMLPAFDGLSALKIAQELAPALPFILVSATLGEEPAIESMRAGASDFVVKQRLNRLPNAVRRALAETAERRGRLAAETRLRAINEQLETIIEDRTKERDRIWRLGQDIFAVVGIDGLFRSVNPAWTAVLGHQAAEVVNRHQSEFRHPEDFELSERWVQQVRQGTIVPELEARYMHKDGSYRWISWRAAPPEDGLIYAIGRDMTETRTQAARLAEAQERLRQSQKMESIGQLTGGVAHDFNNILSIISGNLEFLQRQGNAHLTSRERQSITYAMEGVHRATGLTRSLLAFSRRQPLDPRQVELDRLVGGMSALLKRTIGEDITIHADLAAEESWIHVDPNQLESAILNLAVNARDAMENGGSLVIGTKAVQLSGDQDLPDGRYVVVSVADTGTGMDAETLGKVFEPFFTTKEVGKGTGLGLSQVYGFVSQSGGTVRISSAVGQGTTVKIYLPRLASDAATEEAEQAPLVTPRAVRAETVLVVEDDPDVRRYSAASVRELGYTVLEAHDGPSALKLLHDNPAVDLLFTDVVLPNKMNGKELADQATGERAGLAVLYVSGYSRDALIKDGRLTPNIHLLNKPFSFAQLGTEIRRALDERQIAIPRILVVEDEPLVRMLAVDTLEAAGYRVDQAASGAEALEKMRAGGAVAAVVVDIGLPDTRGDILANQIRQMIASLPIVIASGYQEDDLRARFENTEHMGFVGKPYAGTRLVETLQDLGVRTIN